MLSTRGSRTYHDPLAYLASVVLGVALLAPSFTPTIQLLAIAIVITGCLILSLIVPMNRTIVGGCIVAGIMLSWCWFTMLERTPPVLPSSVTITGTIAQLPALSGGNQTLTVLVDTSSVPFLVNRPVTVLSQTAQDVSAGQHVTCQCRAPIGSSSISRQLWLSQLAKNQAVTLFAQSSIHVDSMNLAPRWWLLRLRSAIVERTSQLWRRPESSLAAGLIVGSRETFSTALTTAMQRTGTTHLVAVSGENVAIVLWVLGYFLPKKRPWFRFLALSILLGIFVVITGETASVLRAGIAAVVLLVGSAVGRPTNPLRLLLIVAAVLATLNPLVVRADLGFQLSFLAVFGLVVFTRPIAQLLPLPHWLGVPISTTLSASLVTAPLLAASFGTVSIISPLTNLVLVAIVSPTMILAGIAVAGSFIVPIVGSLLSWLTTPFLTVILAIINLANKIPGASVAVTLQVWVGWTLTTGIALVGIYLQYRAPKKAILE